MHFFWKGDTFDAGRVPVTLLELDSLSFLRSDAKVAKVANGAKVAKVANGAKEAKVANGAKEAKVATPPVSRRDNWQEVFADEWDRNSRLSCTGEDPRIIRPLLGFPPGIPGKVALSYLLDELNLGLIATQEQFAAKWRPYWKRVTTVKWRDHLKELWNHQPNHPLLVNIRYHFDIPQDIEGQEAISKLLHELNLIESAEHDYGLFKRRLNRFYVKNRDVWKKYFVKQWDDNAPNIRDLKPLYCRVFGLESDIRGSDALSRMLEELNIEATNTRLSHRSFVRKVGGQVEKWRLLQARKEKEEAERKAAETRAREMAKAHTERLRRLWNGGSPAYVCMHDQGGLKCREVTGRKPDIELKTVDKGGIPPHQLCLKRNGRHTCHDITPDLSRSLWEKASLNKSRPAIGRRDKYGLRINQYLYNCKWGERGYECSCTITCKSPNFNTAEWLDNTDHLPDGYKKR